MPVLRSLPGGYTAACAPANTSPPPDRPPRGEVTGFSARAAARNTAFLRAQPREGFDDGDAYACTLTLGRCPETHEEWKRLCDRWFKRVRRMGLGRLHWVVEWTRQGRPHLHASVWLPAGTPNGAARLRQHWLDVTEGHRTLSRAQHVVPIERFGGWACYVGKHAARGVGHYQRSAGRMPEGWTSTGRMWGKLGDWHDVAPEDTRVSTAEFHRFRRIVRKLEVSRALARGNPRGARYARRSLRCTDPKLSAVRGLSVWSDYEGQELALLAAIGVDAATRRGLSPLDRLRASVHRSCPEGEGRADEEGAVADEEEARASPGGQRPCRRRDL